MDILWQYAGMKRTLDFNFQFLPEIIAGDALTGSPTISYSPSDGNLTVANIVISNNKVFGDYTGALPAAGNTYTVTCTVSTQRGAILKMIGQLQIF